MLPTTEDNFFVTDNQVIQYCIADFYHKNFILASHGIRNIKIRCYFYLVT